MDLPKSSLVSVECHASYHSLHNPTPDPGFNKTQAEDKLGEKITTAKKSLLGKMTASDNPSLSWGCVCQLRRDGVSKVHGMCWPGKPGEDS